MIGMMSVMLLQFSRNEMMKRLSKYILLVMLSVLSSCVKEGKDDMASGPRMLFYADVPQTKAFIEDVNRSGNQMVVYDYMTIQRYNDKTQVDKYWYIDHARIICTVDGQQVWDFVETDDYYWLYRSTHKFFGWLYQGPSGYTTVTFFGDHPEFDKNTWKLPLPKYEFTLDSPIYDFLYSDVTERSYSQENHDASPVKLNMNHLFCAFRFNVRSMRGEKITLKSATLSVLNERQATIDYSKTSSDPVEVEYAENQCIPLSMTYSSHLEFTSDTPAKNLFPGGYDPEGYHMMWAQSEDEFKNATLELEYVVGEGSNVEVKTLSLNEFNTKQWLGGNRYDYDVVFTDQMIQLTCNVKPWDKYDTPIDFTDVVVVSDKLQWHNSTVVSIDEHNGQVVLNPNGTPAECYFKIDAPQGAHWFAELVYLDAHSTQAFSFVGESAEYAKSEANVELGIAAMGPVGSIGKINIKANSSNAQDGHRALLRISVRTEDGRTIIVENLCAGHDYNEYTVVQNPTGN